MAIETSALRQGAAATDPLADKKTLRRVLVASSLGTLFLGALSDRIRELDV